MRPVGGRGWLGKQRFLFHRKIMVLVPYSKCQFILKNICKGHSDIFQILPIQALFIIPKDQLGLFVFLEIGNNTYLNPDSYLLLCSQSFVLQSNNHTLKLSTGNKTTLNHATKTPSAYFIKGKFHLWFFVHSAKYCLIWYLMETLEDASKEDIVHRIMMGQFPWLVVLKIPSHSFTGLWGRITKSHLPPKLIRMLLCWLWGPRQGPEKAGWRATPVLRKEEELVDSRESVT